MGKGPKLMAKRSEKFIRSMEKDVPRHDMAYALQLSEDQTLRQLGDMMTDSGYSRWSVARLCKELNVSYERLASCYHKSKVDEGKIRMAAHLPQVMEDTAIDAKSTEVLCPICSGTGSVADDESAVACKECNGKGSVRRPGDQNARKLIFESAGLTGKGIQIDARSLTLNSMDTLEDTLAVVRKVREFQKPLATIEAE